MHGLMRPPGGLRPNRWRHPDASHQTVGCCQVGTQRPLCRFIAPLLLRPPFTLAEIIAGVWLKLCDPGRRLSATGLHLSVPAHAGWD